MRFISVFNILFLLGIVVLSHNLPAAGNKQTNLEQKWLTVLSNSKVKDQLIKLKLNKGVASALYLPQASGQPQGGLIILHGRQQHPDWPGLISSLRQRFPRYGWATLSIQLPLLTEKATPKDYAKSMSNALERIDAAIIYLRQQKIRNIVVIGYELGATTAALYMQKKPNSGIHALIAISTLTWNKPTELDAYRSLSLIEKPVLDVYAMNDMNQVLQAAKQRRPLILQHRNLKKKARDPKNVRYRQLEIVGADHSYSGYETYLLKRMRSWLRVFAPGKAIINK